MNSDTRIRDNTQVPIHKTPVPVTSSSHHKYPLPPHHTPHTTPHLAPPRAFTVSVPSNTHIEYTTVSLHHCMHQWNPRDQFTAFTKRVYNARGLSITSGTSRLGEISQNNKIRYGIHKDLGVHSEKTWNALSKYRSVGGLERRSAVTTANHHTSLHTTPRSSNHIHCLRSVSNTHIACTTAPLNHCITAPLHHCITAPLHHCIIASLHHCITAPLHLCTTVSLYHCITAPLHHCITAPLHHCITVSLYLTHQVPRSQHTTVTCHRAFCLCNQSLQPGTIQKYPFTKLQYQRASSSHQKHPLAHHTPHTTPRAFTVSAPSQTHT
jgi:hypothetical protein